MTRVTVATAAVVTHFQLRNTLCDTMEDVRTCAFSAANSLAVGLWTPPGELVIQTPAFTANISNGIVNTDTEINEFVVRIYNFHRETRHRVPLGYPMQAIPRG